jgi:hypothetical protein
MHELSLIIGSIAVGIVLALLIVGRAGPRVIELKRRDIWLQRLVGRNERCDVPPQPPSE